MAIGDLLQGLLPAAGMGIGGAMGGPIGGFAGGQIGSLLGNYFGGNQQQSAQMQQQPYQQALAGLLQQYQQQPGFDFEPIAQDEMRRFREDILPEVSQQFSSMGAERSSGYNQARQAAGEGLASRLASLRAQTGLQSRGLDQNRMNSLANFLQGQQQIAQRQTESGREPWYQVLGTGASLLPSYWNAQLGQQRNLGQQHQSAQQQAMTPSSQTMYTPSGQGWGWDLARQISNIIGTSTGMRR